jgi:hypothetical protein
MKILPWYFSGGTEETSVRVATVPTGIQTKLLAHYEYTILLSDVSRLTNLRCLHSEAYIIVYATPSDSLFEVCCLFVSR